ncbi:nucleotide exchange factor GrpE [Rhodococcus sp. SGAir0479]|uniref:nucleotide exchange factor GrpE n=1 Tax=Rhodococcus sp. SGAir0479 TaxID=2567884 RepID=UPI0010CD2B21|nr:nucleotide exchange factor GrpE [Rhodococcus sp. SGAir0479]QCQ92528.1 nucleotide exchange factor GrpE [Rhodococcus sp. SGAir0479]
MTAENPDRDPVITDGKVVDPFDTDDTASVASEEAAEAGAAEGDELAKVAAERDQFETELGYAKAEIANIRRNSLSRIDRAVEDERAAVVGKFLDLVDDLDRARAHGDLESGPMKALSDKLSGILDGLGLAAFGEEGEPFSADLHEAVQMEGDGDRPVLGAVLRKGYRLGDRVLRTAMVTVTHGESAADAAAE